ncbi:ATP-binding protein [Streptomyces qinzhouensis]|uniref:AfsR family transcriptional regulator n=1 Tax=Streptomyces qinzhouensis TaxID=2599401 RepID=A0A5B8ICA5_9ACTN|nr:BTAD domain-containing putative transcriptional regulator [Streptomyces qinzhouensis]QDY75442.1 AfsR family transcriptional regulator [Streptomyces qinzhouensis]
MTIRYRVLGPARALRPDGSGGDVGPRVRALLTALAAAGGRPVPTGELAARVWAGEPPRDPAAALQALVGRLRRELGRDAVALTPGGYRLVAARDEVDVFRFERLAAEGHAALTADRPAEAARLLGEALALWQGPPLADLPDGDRDPLAVRARLRHAEARRGAVAAALALGRADAVLPEAAALAAAEPLDEPSQTLWIRALAASGRAAAALAAYEEVRVRLAERLGTDPGAGLRALHAELLAGTPTATAAEAQPVPGNLPARLTSFVGRRDDLADVAAALSAHRLVTLVGAGGAGKTRLALEAADPAAPGAPRAAHPDGVWIAELAPVRDGGTAVADAVLTALGVREPPLAVRAPGPASDPLARLVEHCRHRRMLLIVDNCEHVVDAAAGLVARVLEHCPGVTVLATSREPLGVPGEVVRPVGPLSPDAALRLLGERGAAARPGFTVRDDPRACAEICRRLDGLPLAVELAAARLRMLTPRQIADRLDDRFRLLTGGSRTALPRQQTLRAVVDWSWDLLDHHEHTVLRRLSVFAGGCALPEAEAVCGAGPDGGPGGPDVLHALGALVDKSLVVAAPGDGSAMRYRLLETVAEYAAERLDATGEREAVERCHLRTYRELTRTGEAVLRGPGGGEWMARLDTELGNVRAALRTAVRHGEEQEGLCLVLSLGWYWQLRSLQSDARTWSAAVAALGPDPFEAPVQRAGPVTGRCTDLPPPWSGARLWEARRGVRLTALAAGGADGMAVKDPRALDRLRWIVAAYEPGLPQLCRQPAAMWFFCKLMTGGYPGLDESADAFVAACEEQYARGAADGWDLALSLLMRIRLRSGGFTRPPGGEGPPEDDEAEDGRPDPDRALALFEAAGDDWGIAESYAVRGEDHEWHGRYEPAAADYTAALRVVARSGPPAQASVYRARLLSLTLRTTTDPAEREAAERELLAAARESGATAGETEFLATPNMLLARHYGSTGRTEAARAQLDIMDQQLGAGAPELFRGLISGIHAWLDCQEGQYARARDRCRTALRLLAGLGDFVTRLMVDQFLCAAWAMAHLGEAADAAKLIAVFDTAGHRSGGLGLQPFHDERRTRAEAESAAVAALGEEAWRRAYEEGGSLPVVRAVELV